MLTMNRATVLGHAGRNPEMRTLPSGDEVALFSLATNERFRRRDGTEGESTEWHAIVAFGNAAQTVRKLVHRGAAVLVEGRIATRTWTDRSGTEHRTSEILVSGPQARVNVLTRRGREPEDEPPGGPAAPGAAKPEEPAQAEAVAAADTDAGTASAPDGTGADAPPNGRSDEAGAPDTAAAESGEAAPPGAVSDAGGTHGAKAAQAGAACGDASASAGDVGAADGTSAGCAMGDARAEEARTAAADDAGSAGSDGSADREERRGAATGSAAVAAGEADDGHA